ncbi:MAG: hypothetical protein ABFC38_11825 [Methanospirillum sp.]
MSTAIGSAVRDDDDGIAIRLEAGPRRGCYRVAAERVPDLLAGIAAATLWSDDAPVGIVAPSRDPRFLLGAFRDLCGFTGGGPLVWAGATAFLIPRAHLAAHYDRHDCPVDVLDGGA